MLFLALAFAHSGLEEPPPRYPSDGFSDNKACPCGVGTGGGLCTGDTSDPDRSSTITEFEAGEVITVRWAEAIGHAGRWRVAFDPDGADLDDFNEHILIDIEDPPGDDGNIGEGEMWEVQVTLPSEPCDNCTLQLVQVMDGQTTVPADDPTGRSSYYQCADIVILAPPEPTGVTGDTGTSGTTTPGDTDTDDTGPSSTQTTTDPQTGDTTDDDGDPTGTNTGGTTSTGTSSDVELAGDGEESGGCGCDAGVQGWTLEWFSRR